MLIMPKRLILINIIAGIIFVKTTFLEKEIPSLVLTNQLLDIPTASRAPNKKIIFEEINFAKLKR